MDFPEVETDILVQGLPLASATHGGLGWSTIGLLRSAGHVALVDVGGPGNRITLLNKLAERGLAPEDITDILVTHCHWDHVYNITSFARARLHVGEMELKWAQNQPRGRSDVADLHVDFLRRAGDRLRLLQPGQFPLPGVAAVNTSGHTPGHLAYLVGSHARRTIFVGDAIKNRVELASGEFLATADVVSSRASRASVLELARDSPLIVVFGHDVPVLLTPGQRTVDLDYVPGSIEILDALSGEWRSRPLDPSSGGQRS